MPACLPTKSPTTSPSPTNAWCEWPHPGARGEGEAHGSILTVLNGTAQDTQAVQEQQASGTPQTPRGWALDSLGTSKGFRHFRFGGAGGV